MKITKRLLAILLTLVMAVSFCACGSSDGDGKTDVSSNDSQSDVSDTSSVEEIAAFEVKVVDDMGNPVEGVMLQVCKDSCIPAKTDKEGIAKFNIEITDGHKLSVLSCPTGYEYRGEAEIYLEEGCTEYEIELSEAA